MSIKAKLSVIIILIGLMFFLITGFIAWTQLDEKGQAASLDVSKMNKKLEQGVKVLAIICLLILFVSHRLLSDVVKSINVLKKGAETIGKGKYDHRIDLSTADELGKLAVSFNKMTENLQKTTISRDYVDNIVRSMHGGLIVTSPERYIQTVNSSACDMLGYSKKEFHGMPLENIFANESAIFKKSFDELLNKGFIRYVETSFKTKDGHRIPVLFSASVMRGADEQEQGIVLVSADITERKESELKQNRLLEELDSVNKELNDFAYIVSHDLKAPLRGISSIATWIQEDYKDRLDKDGKEQLGLLVNRVNRLQNLIDGILHYSRVGRVNEEKEEVDLNEVVIELIDSLSLPSHIMISIDGRLPTVFCEPTRMSQLFQNLISNAVKYMDKEQGLVRIGCIEKDDCWQFFISDNGPGIDEKYFKIFFTIAKSIEGEKGGNK
jgi:PAS domain S-box-containing protein